MSPEQKQPSGPEIYRQAMEVIATQHTMTQNQAVTYLAEIPRGRRLPLIMALANVTLALVEMIAEGGDERISVDTVLEALGERVAALDPPPEPPVEPLTKRP